MELHAGTSQWEKWSLLGRERRGEAGRGEESREGRTKKWPTKKARGQKGQTGFCEILPEIFFIYITQKKAQEKYHSQWTKRASSNGRIQNSRGFNSRGFNVYFYICLYQKILHFVVGSVGYSQKATTSRRLV